MERTRAGIGELEAQQIARVMAGLAATSRVMILGRLRAGPSTVGELAAAVGMGQPAVSHQLRILRELDLVIGSRDGRHTVYELRDADVAGLLDETRERIGRLAGGDQVSQRPGSVHRDPAAHGEPGPAELGTAELGPAELGPAELGTVELVGRWIQGLL